jgi:hypothetical protein
MSLFSGPYTILSPPPTAGPLPVIERANLNTPYSGGSGPGPSTIGPNPVISTLTFAAGNPSSGNTTGTINMASVLNILDPSVPTPNNYHFQFATNQDPQAGGYPPYVSQYQSTLNNFAVWGPSASATQTGNFSFSTDITGRSQIVAANATGGLSTLVISADSVLIPTSATISSLSVSSVNGGAPGGSAGPNPVVSSIVVNSGDYSISSGGIEFTGQADFFGYAAVSNGGGQPIQYPNPNSTIIGVAKTPGVNPEYSDVGIGRIVLVGQPSFGGTITKPGIIQAGDGSSISNSDILIQASGNILLNSNGVSSLVCVGGTTTISSLNCSTINGAAPGGGGLQFSTLGIPGGSGVSTFGLVANQTNTLVEFSTVAGHVYTASVVARASVGPVADTDSVASEIVDSAAGNEIIGSWPLSQVSTLSGTFLQQVGGSVTWKAGGTGAFFSLYPTVAANARVDSVNLIDFGAI